MESIYSDSFESFSVADFEHTVEGQSISHLENALEHDGGFRKIFFQCVENKDWLSEHTDLASKLAVVLNGAKVPDENQAKYIISLLKSGIVPDQKGLRSYAEQACRHDDGALFDVICSAGLDLDERNSDGETFLHTAIRAGATEICGKMIKELPCDQWLYQLTPSLQDPIALAVEHEEYAMASKLLEKVIDSSESIFLNMDCEDEQQPPASVPDEFEGELFYEAPSDEVFNDCLSEEEIVQQAEYEEFREMLRSVDDSAFQGTLAFGWLFDALPESRQKMIDGALTTGLPLHSVPRGGQIAPLAQLPSSDLIYYYKRTKQEGVEVSPGTFDHILLMALDKAGLYQGAQLIQEFQRAGLTVDASLWERLSDGGRRPLPVGGIPSIRSCGLNVTNFHFEDEWGEEVPKLCVAAASGDMVLVEELLKETNDSFDSVASHPLYSELVRYALKAEDSRLGCELLKQGESVSYPWSEDELSFLMFGAHPHWLELENVVELLREDTLLKLVRVLVPMRSAPTLPLILKADDRGFSQLCMELINQTTVSDLESTSDRVKILFAQHFTKPDTEFWNENGLCVFRACLKIENYELAKRCISYEDPKDPRMLEELLASSESIERDSLCLEWLGKHTLEVLPEAVKGFISGKPGYSHDVCKALVANLNRSSNVFEMVFQLRKDPETFKHLVKSGLNVQLIQNRSTLLHYVLKRNTGDLSPSFLRLVERYDHGLTKELVGRKELAHRFGLKGDTRLLGSKVSLEGWTADESSVALFFYVRDFHARLIENGMEDLIRALPRESAEVVKNLSLGEIQNALEEIEEVLGFTASESTQSELVQRVKEGKITALLTRFTVAGQQNGHAVGAVFDGQNFARCNKGYGYDEMQGPGVSISKMGKLDGIEEAINLLTNRQTDFEEGFGTPLTKALDLQPTMHLPQSAQKVGNCSVANANSLNLAVNYFVFRKLLPDHPEAAFDLARALKDLRTSDSRLATLQGYLDSHRSFDFGEDESEGLGQNISSQEPDRQLIQQIYDQGGAMWFPSQKQRAVRKMIDDWKKTENSTQ